jgi:DNA-binding transcriptional LysR family regulator
MSHTLLTPLVTAFQASHPNVGVQIRVTDRTVLSIRSLKGST